MASKFPIVGVGASAGGLQALEQMFRHVPGDAEAAFIIVTHLARGHLSSLPEILARYTPMRVETAGDRVRIEANTVYVCPPDSVLMIEGDRLRLSQAGEAMRKPIDVFLSSLGEQQGEAAVGVLLSGGGSDGTLGIKAVKGNGGLTIAQGGDGDGPMQSTMPDAAIAAGVVDLVLSAEDIGRRIVEHARSFDKLLTEDDTESERYRAIYPILLRQIGHDFSGYKQSTFRRRVRRRMQVLQINDIDQYAARMRQDPDEVTALFRDLLIGVTTFFRDPDAFEMLEKDIIPRLFENRGADEAIRIWVPGCATGEEVYSIAILVREHLDTRRARTKVQIFATDIDDQALSVARAGRYPKALLANVSKQRLKQYFNGDEISFVINKEIRDLCIFSSHSVIRDPPFSRIDLISCRNLLIYLGSSFQNHVIPLFHFALRPHGYLFLGTAENVSRFSDLFAPIDKKQRIFQRRDAVVRPPELTLLASGGPTRAGGHDAERRSASSTANMRRAVETRVLERFAPTHVLVNRDGDILYFSAHTGRYLEPAAGTPNRQLLTMARRGLRLDLRAALQDAVRTRRPAARRRIPVEIDEATKLVNLTVEPLGDDNDDPLFLVLFEDVDELAEGSPIPGRNDSRAEEDAAQLEQELRETRDRLQGTIEEYETAVEELKSSNEELQSMNEELQSTNEELETSKEELQSVNEELHAVNAELSAKVDELDQANADLRNVFESTQIATIFLDGHLVIRNFTRAAAGIFNLISTDRGRPLTDIANQLLDAGDLKRDIQIVFEHGKTIERRVERQDRSLHYLMRILPYRAHNHTVEGALVTFIDVSELVRGEIQQKTLVEELNHRVRNILAVVSALAGQTARRSGSPGDFAKTFLERLRAMGESYDLLSRRDWSKLSLQSILTAQLKPYVGEGDERAQIGGPEMSFKPAQSLALGLVFHELVTNAVKYGALSKPSGRVSVTWRFDNGRVCIVWLERDGPEIGKPTRRGFGTELIERELKSSLGGKVKFDYDPKGLTVEIAFAYELK